MVKITNTKNIASKKYTIFLDNILIGTTKLGYGDPPMGVVFGEIDFLDKNIGYDFIKKYCIDHKIDIFSDFPEEKLISTGQINTLKIYINENIELLGEMPNIEGMDLEGYTITMVGINSEIYEKEFSHHINSYYNKFPEM